MLSLRSLLVASLAMLLVALHASVRAQPTAPIYFGATEGRTLSGVVAGPDDSAYLVFAAGGPDDLGTVTRRAADGGVSVLHAFSGADGARPEVPLRFGPDGALYGTTSQGGAYGNGTAFRITTTGELTTLHDFSVDDGGQVRVPLLPEADGGLYGVTSGNSLLDCDAANSVNCAASASTTGKVFVLSRDGAFRVLYDGIDHPGGGLMRASTGVLYGTWRAPYSQGPGGAVYRLTPDGELSVSSPNTYPAFDPFGELQEASDGYVYGTRTGAVFRMSLDFEPRAVDYQDSPFDDGPYVAATFGLDGNQYFVGNSAGLYRATRSGVVSRLATLDLNLGGITSALAVNADGLLIGRDDYLVQLTLTGAGSVLSHFGSRYGDGLDTLTLTSRNELYGTTLRGGEYNSGTVFRVDASSKLSTVHSFTDPLQFLSQLRCPFVEAKDGALYAVIEGFSPALVRLNALATPPTLETLHVFPQYGPYDQPLSVSGCLFAGDDGMLYGNMQIEARDPAGRIPIYRFDPVSKELRILARVSFLSHMLRTKAGTFYGTRNSASGDSQFFQVRSDGSLNVLHSLPASDNHYFTSLAEGLDGAIYLYATGPVNSGDRATTSDDVYRWTTSGGFESYYSFERSISFWLEDVRMSVGTLSEVYVSGVVNLSGGQSLDWTSYVILPDRTRLDLPHSGSPLLMGADGRVYRTKPLSRGGYSGFQLEPIDLTAADGVR